MEALKLGWRDAVDHFYSVAQDMLQIGTEFAKSLKTALSGTFSVLVHGDFGKIKNAWESMLDTMTDALADAIANQWVKLISQFMQYAMSSFGSAFGGGGGGYSYGFDSSGYSATGYASSGHGATGFMSGGIVPGSLIPMMQQPVRLAMGGVMNRPTLAWVAEAGQREAVVPLPNGRSIPVEIQAPGGAGQAPGVTVNLIGQGAEQAKVRTSQSDIEGMVVDIILGNINRRGPLSQLMR